MSAASQLTILLTLKDRVPFTFRWLAYADRVRLPFKILIADGGTDDAVASALSANDRYPNLDIEYVRYPHDRSYTDYYAKITDALSRIRTPLVVMADNDDFFFVDGLARAAQFLSDNPSYAACDGRRALFWVSAPLPGAAGEGVYGQTVDWKCSSRLHSDVAETGRERIRDQSLGSSDAFYAVRPTGLLHKQFQLVRDFNPRDLFLVEDLITFLTAISGKIMQLDTLYIARQQNSPDGSGGAHQEMFGDWFDRMLLPTWSDDFTRFVDITSSALAEADAIPVSEARKAIVATYKMSVAPSLLADIMEQPSITATMPTMIQIVRRLVALPESSLIKQFTRRLYRRAGWVSHDLVRGTEFLAHGSAGAAREFRPLYEFLTGDSGTGSSRTSGT